jgi:hypothetical protein
VPERKTRTGPQGVGALSSSVSPVQKTKRFRDDIGMAARMLNVVADRLTIVAEIDDNVIADDTIIDRITQPNLDTETVCRRIVFESLGHSTKSLSLKTL